MWIMPVRPANNIDTVFREAAVYFPMWKVRVNKPRKTPEDHFGKLMRNHTMKRSTRKPP